MAEQTVTGQVQKQLAEGGHALGQLAKAYVAAWREVGVGVLKDATNPHLGNQYATLEAHLNQIKGVFAKHGLAILQAPGLVVDGKLTIETLLIHESGQNIAIYTHVPLVPDKQGKITAQIMGSATTYGCRYVLRGLAGLAATDDDGNVASLQPAAPRGKRREEPEDGGEDPEEAEEAAVLAAIEAFAGTVDELEKTVRPRVEEIAKKAVNEAYLAKRRALKAASKEAK